MIAFNVAIMLRRDDCLNVAIMLVMMIAFNVAIMLRRDDRTINVVKMLLGLSP